MDSHSPPGKESIELWVALITCSGTFMCSKEEKKTKAFLSLGIAICLWTKP